MPQDDRTKQGHTSLYWTPVAVSIVVTILAVLLWIAESLMRHSAAASMPKSLLVLFPLPIILEPTIGPLSLLLGLAQFPSYGVLLGLANENNKFLIRFAQIGLGHAVLAVLAVLAYSR